VRADQIIGCAALAGAVFTSQRPALRCERRLEGIARGMAAGAYEGRLPPRSSSLNMPGRVVTASSLIAFNALSRQNALIVEPTFLT
jgi:hypothetical protein